MIAASEPQEFIPSGRQQVQGHPGLPVSSRENRLEHLNLEFDAFVLRRLEKVSINEESATEWWLVRESPDYFNINVKKQEDSNVKNGETNEDVQSKSFSWRTADPDTSLPKRLLSEFNETKSINKSYLSSSNYLNLKKNDLYKNDSCIMEEELYIKGCTAIWSRGMQSSDPENAAGMHRGTLCTYTMESTIKHAGWCTFYAERPTFSTFCEEVADKPDEPLGKPLPSICLLDATNMKVFSSNGEYFIVYLEFPVLNIWESKFGLLVEKQFDKCKFSASREGSVFSLAHPLDSFCPIALKQGGIQILNNQSYKIVYVCCKPSICLMYDSRSGLHYIFKLRRIRSNDWTEMSTSNVKLGSPMPSPSMISQKVKQSLSLWSGHGVGLPLAEGSPYNSRATSFSSLLSPRSPISPMAQLSRCQSPSASGNWISRSMQHEDITSTTAKSQLDVTCLPKSANPELCFEHLWTESPGLQKNSFNSGGANKGFLSVDFIGQNYFCYLVPSRVQLFLVRMDLTHENDLIFGMTCTINAKDAVTLPDTDCKIIHSRMTYDYIRYMQVHLRYIWLLGRRKK